MTDLELYKHFNKYVFEVNEDGICFVSYYYYKDFLKGLPIDDTKEGFESFIDYNGDLYFNIDNVSHLFDDFETFKEIFMNEEHYLL